MSHGTNALSNLMEELGDSASELLINELIHYLSSDDLIRFVHHFRTMHDMIDGNPEDEEEADDTTEDMPQSSKLLYPGHNPTNYDEVDW